MEGNETSIVCVSCKKECGAHSCKVCRGPCHAIEPCCRRSENDDEGYGASVTCKACSERAQENVTVNDNSTKKWWTTKRSSSVELKPKVKKVKQSETSTSAHAKNPGFACLECVKEVSKGKRDEKTAYICRKDSTSINRHKTRWHSGVGNEKCTIEPANSVKVKQIKRAEGEAKVSVPISEPSKGCRPKQSVTPSLNLPLCPSSNEC